MKKCFVNYNEPEEEEEEEEETVETDDIRPTKPPITHDV